MAGKKTVDVGNGGLSREEKIFHDSFKTGAGILEYILDETLNILSEFTTGLGMNEFDRILEKEGYKLSELYVRDNAAFRFWERERLIPYLKEIRQREIENIIPTQPVFIIAPKEVWPDTQEALADVAVQLYNNKKYRFIGEACRALSEKYSYKGKSINCASLYVQARQIHADQIKKKV